MAHKGVNPLKASFRLKSNPSHRRLVRCHRIDQTTAGWACHQKVFVPGQKYIRHITEWFQPELWDYFGKSYVTVLAPLKEVVAKEKKIKKAPAAQSVPKAMDQKDDDAPEPVVASLPAPTTIKKAVPNDKEEMPGEYNPRAHPEKALGDPEDLIVFSDMVDANFIAQQRRNKLMQLRARQKIAGTPGQPIVSGYEPG